MKRDHNWSVRVERRPHRGAVQRLRKAYGLLRHVSKMRSSCTRSGEKAKETSRFIQEVQK